MLLLRTLRVGHEDEDYFDYRWWPVDRIVESSERFYPGRLPELLGAHLRGEQVDEPYEIWSLIEQIFVERVLHGVGNVCMVWG